ncbi:MAG: GNAT family N-acetyltransferase [Chloroflexota bacterium]
MKTILSQWQTEHLTIQDSTLNDTQALLQIFNACSYAEPWDPTFHPVEANEIRELIEKSMQPASASSPPFRLQTISTQETNLLVGYFHCFHAHPHPDTVFISMFVIHPDYQAHRYGQEAVAGLKQQLAALGVYQKIWLDVYLKNWPALRFWIRQGFTQIIDYDGDKVHSDENTAVLVLEASLAV